MTKEERIDKFTAVMKPFITEYFMIWLCEHNFFEATGSRKDHSVYAGGLFDHSLAVTNNLIMLTQKLDLHWQLERSPYIIGMFHDICKVDMFIKDSNGEMLINPDQQILGHGEKSVIILQDQISLTEEERMCIKYHMYNFDTAEITKEATKYYHQNINAFYTHVADTLAAVVQKV